MFGTPIDAGSGGISTSSSSENKSKNKSAIKDTFRGGISTYGNAPVSNTGLALIAGALILTVIIYNFKK